jgi:hypothetical protein
MSTIVCLKENDTLILGTDSRFMKVDFSGVASDTAQKVFEIAPQTFIATSGRLRACNFQTEKARELANELGTADIRKIAAALSRESLPCLTELVEIMRPYEPLEAGIGHAIAGRSLLHGCVLVGRDQDGNLGLVAQTYQVNGGEVTCTAEEYFGPVRKIIASTGAPPDRLAAGFGFVQDPTIWTDPPESVVRRILRDMQVTGVTGGPDQIVCLDSEGARWISPPPNVAVSLDGDLLSATITATVSMISPAISGGSIVGSTLTITVGSSTVTISPTAAGGFPGVQVVDATYGTTYQLGGPAMKVFFTSIPNKYAAITPGQVVMSDGAGGLRTLTATSDSLVDAPLLTKAAHGTYAVAGGAGGFVTI